MYTDVVLTETDSSWYEH